MKKTTIIFLFFTTLSFSQSITTRFIHSGYLTREPNGTSTSTCKFKNKKEVVILEFVKDNWWKVKYNNCIGYVTSPYLSISQDLVKIKEIKLLKITKDDKRRNDSLAKVRDSILRVKKILEIKEKRKIDSIKKNIIKYASDSLLITEVKSGSKLKTKPSIFGDIILTLDENQEVIVLDYVDTYFKVCINSSCGFINEIYFNYGYIGNFNPKNELLIEFKKIKEIENQAKIREERLNKLEKEKDIYLNKCTYNINEKDEFTGLTRMNTIFYKILEYNSKEIEIQLKRYGGTKYIRIKSQQDLGCTSPYSNNRSYVKFRLENGDIVTFYHLGDVECGNFNLLGKLTSKDIYRLKKSPIKTVRLAGTEYYHDIKGLFFKDFFIKKLDCIK